MQVGEQMIKVSIIVPVYNSEKFLERCIMSLIDQTLSEIEIILVNDASIDNSLFIMNSFKKKYPNKIKVVDSKINLKQGGARNLGLDVAAGEYIGYVDSDDFVDSTMYEKLYSKAKADDSDIVLCDFLRTCNGIEGTITTTANKKYMGEVDSFKRKKLILSPGSCCCKIYKKNILKDNNLKYPEHIFYEDNFFNHLLPLYINKCSYVEEPLYYYYQNDMSTTASINPNIFFDRCVSAIKLLDEVKNRGFYNEYKEEYDYIFYYYYFFSTVISCLVSFENIESKKYFELRRYIVQNAPYFHSNAYFKYNYNWKQRILYQLIIIFPKTTLLLYSFIRNSKNILRPLKHQILGYKRGN